MKKSFFDSRLFLNIALTLLGCTLLLYCIKIAQAAHLPFLIACVSATALGFLEPRRGWLLAIIQAVVIWITYTFFFEHPTNSSKQELETFSLYGSMILTFIGSFVGGRLKRLFDRN